MRRTPRSAALALLILAACSSTEPGDARPARELGVIEVPGRSPAVTLAESVRAGEPLEVTVNTFGNPCTEVHSTDATVSGATAEVVPYDVVTTLECIEPLVTLTHRATLRFRRPGTATVHVRGRTIRGERLTVTRTVTVTAR